MTSGRRTRDHERPVASLAIGPAGDEPAAGDRPARSMARPLTAVALCAVAPLVAAEAAEAAPGDDGNRATIVGTPQSADEGDPAAAPAPQPSVPTGVGPAPRRAAAPRVPVVPRSSAPVAAPQAAASTSSAPAARAQPRQSPARQRAAGETDTVRRDIEAPSQSREPSSNGDATAEAVRDQIKEFERALRDRLESPSKPDDPDGDEPPAPVPTVRSGAEDERDTVSRSQDSPHGDELRPGPPASDTFELASTGNDEQDSDEQDSDEQDSDEQDSGSDPAAAAAVMQVMGGLFGRRAPQQPPQASAATADPAGATPPEPARPAGGDDRPAPGATPERPAPGGPERTAPAATPDRTAPDREGTAPAVGPDRTAPDRERPTGERRRGQRDRTRVRQEPDRSLLDPVVDTVRAVPVGLGIAPERSRRARRSDSEPSSPPVGPAPRAAAPVRPAAPAESPGGALAERFETPPAPRRPARARVSDVPPAPRRSTRLDRDGARAVANRPAVPDDAPGWIEPRGWRFAGARMFAADDQAAAYGRSVWSRIGKLPGRVTSVLQRYLAGGSASPDFRKVDEVLRGSRKASPTIRQTVRVLDRELSSLALPEDLVVVRALARDAFGTPLDSLEGRTLTDPGYLSMNLLTAPRLSDRAPVGFHLRVPKGTPGAFMGQLSPATGPLLLLGRGLSYRIDSVGVNATDNRVHVYATVVER